MSILIYTHFFLSMKVKKSPIFKNIFSLYAAICKKVKEFLKKEIDNC